MNKLEAYSTTLERAEIDTLLKYYRRAKNEKTQHFWWEGNNQELDGDYPTIKALAALGFFDFETEERTKGTVNTGYFLTLYSSAMQRGRFEGFSPIRQQLAILMLQYKDGMAVIAFILSIGLAVLRVLEVLQK